MAALSLPVLALVAVVVAFGGLVKGTAGFGYAIASTALLAEFLSPSVAVVVMILPMLVANLALLGEFDGDDFADCAARFWPYVALAMVGTAVGMALLDAVPTALLTLAIGVFTLGYVAVKQPWVALPGERLVAEYCFRTGPVAKASLGFVSGFVFGVSNVAVQVVAYLDSLSLDRPTFAGVLAMILVGISGLRVGLAWTFGLYDSSSLLLYSALVSVPGVLGVAAGRRLRGYVPSTYEQVPVLVLLGIVGVRLLSQAA
jgi:uncharacterized membrane protein YfcA